MNPAWVCYTLHLSPANLVLLTRWRVLGSYWHISSSGQAPFLHYLFMQKDLFVQIARSSVSFPVSFWWTTFNLLFPFHERVFPGSYSPINPGISHGCSVGIHFPAPKLNPGFSLPITNFSCLLPDTFPVLQHPQPFSTPLVSIRLSASHSFSMNLLHCFFLVLLSDSLQSIFIQIISAV